MIYTNFREIDKLGRIVISKDIRNHLDINRAMFCTFEASDDSITIKKAEAGCVFCGAKENLTEFQGKHICRQCLDN